MPRNVRTYEHFCVLARALERVGDRWSLLVVRDLLSGPKRFTDLMSRLGGITPKTLTQRLRELEDIEVVVADREAGRREVWYSLSPAGAELAPAIEALAWWAWRHAWRAPAAGEAVHAEHVLLALTLMLNHEADERRPVRWSFQMSDGGEYTLSTDGRRWSLSSQLPSDPPDVAVVATTAGWLEFVRDPTAGRDEEAGVEVTGSAAAVRRFERLVRAFSDAASAEARG